MISYFWKHLPYAHHSIDKTLVEVPMPKRRIRLLDPALVVNAYTQGIFPMAGLDGNIHWYAPDPRAILEHENLHVSRSLRATIRKGIYEVRMDTAFEAVMHYCAAREERNYTMRGWRIAWRHGSLAYLSAGCTVCHWVEHLWARVCFPELRMPRRYAWWRWSGI